METTVYRWMEASSGSARTADTSCCSRRVPCHRCAQIIHHPSSIINSTGFTLIELLVVIAVIAVLLAILLPSLSRVRKQARGMVCQSRLKQWGTTFALYTEANEGRLPFDTASALWILRGADPGTGDPNEPQTRNPIRTKGIACCPMATRP